MDIARVNWEPDILEGFQRSGVGASTLIGPVSQPAEPRGAVIHVHGYNDYFFQTHVAQAFVDAGWAFYAVDLARAGRSLRPGDIPHLMHDVAEQGEGIGAAADVLAAMHPGAPIVIHGHSTGGLTAAVWAADSAHPALKALVLDSPLFGARHTSLQRALSRTLPTLASVRPLAVVSRGPSVYAAHQHVSGGGRWDFDLTLKRPEGVPIRAAWANAVRHAQARVWAGLGLDVPVLVARSDSSGPDSPQNPLLDQQDTVLDVAAIALMTPRLGSAVTELVIPGGVHELSLSRDEPRAAYLQGVLAWLASVIA